jgi:cytochrome c-type biogenesis protein
MERLFSALSGAVQGTPGIALAASFVWGILSVILSPCHLSSIPLIVGFIGKQGETRPGKAFITSSLFALGILVTIAVIGAITAAAGRMMGDVGRYGSYFVAFVFLLVGLHLFDVIPMPWSGAGGAAVKRKGYFAALILGLIFGVALGPCTFAYMAPILAVALKLGSTDILYAAGLLFAYGVGHCVVIVAAGTSTGLVQGYLNWHEKSRGVYILRRVCGVLVLLGGAYLVCTTL